ncbi:protein HAPLESS 2-like [Selaginella moellendorffii]|uniref:protein HAPLESS 2-like n=1 Tax=Selaginella moellendorffii TaxID=88036 RepID=UPI000D1C735D|nr:protein HAPLESS 2-like [Selaginella moellendorffii]|eukprot:XP_024532398.1 protein HAPLESS 2-like [Selaginella moellendorffii]
MEMAVKWILLFLLQALLWNPSINMTTISKSDLDVCVNTGDPNAIQCKKKILVTVAIPSGDGGNGEALIAEVKDPTSRDGKQVLEKSISVNIAKTDSIVKYALEYLKNVAGDLNERVIKKKKGCNTKLNDKATCGVLGDSKGNVVPGSSGFCCTCKPLKQIKHFRGMPKPGHCGISDAGYAFCLRFGQMWCVMFRIRTGTISFEITITLTDQNGNKAHTSRARNLSV